MDMVAKYGLAMQYNNCVPWQQLTHQLYHEQTLPLFVKGVVVRITTSLLHNIILVISITNMQGQRCRLLTTCFVGILDASGHMQKFHKLVAGTLHALYTILPTC